MSPCNTKPYAEDGLICVNLLILLSYYDVGNRLMKECNLIKCV